MCGRAPLTVRFLILAAILVIGILIAAILPAAYWFVWGPAAGVAAGAAFLWIVFSNASSDMVWRRQHANQPTPTPASRRSSRFWPSMTYVCPHCGVAFGWRRKPVIQRRSTSPRHYRLVCPRCDTVLMLNRHPAEKLGDASLVVPIAAVVGAIYFKATPLALMIAVGAGVLATAAAQILVIVRTRDWPRYSVVPEECK